MKYYNLKIQLFEEICAAYSHELQRFIYSLTRKDQFAMEEIFQNTMVAALSGLKSLRENEKMKTWIFSIAKAEAKRYYKNNQNKLCVEYSDLTDYEEEPINGAGFGNFTEAVENREIIVSLINKLSDEEQQIYILHYFYDLKQKEISEILNINYSTVRSIHVRGLNKLKELLMEGELIDVGR